MISSQETCLEASLSAVISTLMFFEYSNNEYLSVGDWNGIITIYAINVYNQVSFSKKVQFTTKLNEDPIFCQVFFKNNLLIGTGYGHFIMFDINSCFRNVESIQYIGKHEIGLIGLKTIESESIAITAGWDGLIMLYRFNPIAQKIYEIDTERKIICFGRFYNLIFRSSRHFYGCWICK